MTKVSFSNLEPSIQEIIIPQSLAFITLKLFSIDKIGHISYQNFLLQANTQ